MDIEFHCSPKRGSRFGVLFSELIWGIRGSEKLFLFGKINILEQCFEVDFKMIKFFEFYKNTIKIRY